MIQPCLANLAAAFKIKQMQCEQKLNSLNELLALNYPGLVAECNKYNDFIISGTTQIELKWYRLKLLLPHYPELRQFQLYVLQNLGYELYNSTKLELQADWSIVNFLAHLPQLLPPPPSTADVALAAAPTDIGNIYADILELHNRSICHIQLNKACSRIRCSRFVGYEQHYLQLELPTLRLLEHSLPDSVPWQSFLARACTLGDVLTLFQRFLQDLKPFYESLQDIDELCHVLQPSPITSKHNMRLFLLKERVYLKLTIPDPFASTAVSLQIIGSTVEVARLRRLLSDGLGSWDAELDIHKNLLRIFDLCYFPMPPSDVAAHQQQLEEEHCNICFVYRLDDGQVPIVGCDNERCVLKCHAACLKEWFNTLSDGKSFLEVTFGACPYCKAKLSTSFAALLDN